MSAADLDPFGAKPAAERVFLRIEFADGRVREFEAEKPYKVSMKVDALPHLKALYVASPLMIPDGFEATSVALSFEASRDPAHPMVIRAEGRPL